MTKPQFKICVSNLRALSWMIFEEQESVYYSMGHRNSIESKKLEEISHLINKLGYLLQENLFKFK